LDYPCQYLEDNLDNMILPIVKTNDNFEVDFSLIDNVVNHIQNELTELLDIGKHNFSIG